MLFLYAIYKFVFVFVNKHVCRITFYKIFNFYNIFFIFKFMILVVLQLCMNRTCKDFWKMRMQKKKNKVQIMFSYLAICSK